MTKFQKTIISIMVGVMEDRDNLQLLKLVFKEINKDNSAIIKVDEIRQYQEELNILDTNFDEKWQPFFEQISSNKSGEVDYNKFLSAAVDHKKLVTKENIEKAFKLFDTNKEGLIDINHFKQALPLSKRK